MNLPKKFSKVKLLQIMGFCGATFNTKTLEFETSPSLRFMTFLKIFLKVSMPLRFFASVFFPKQSIYQLYCGSMFNFLPGKLLVKIFDSKSKKSPSKMIQLQKYGKFRFKSSRKFLTNVHHPLDMARSFMGAVVSAFKVHASKPFEVRIAIEVKSKLRLSICL